MQLSQSGEVGQAAVLYVTDMVIAKAQPGKSETRGRNVKSGEIRALQGTFSLTV